jgi:hypothetical protein
MWHQTSADRNANNLGRPRIQVQMTDKDVLERVAGLFKTKVLGPYGPYTTQKISSYYVCCPAKFTVGWMMTLLPLMGERRQSKIKEILQKWKEKT